MAQVRYVVGGCLVHLDKEAAEARLAAELEKHQAESAQLTADLKSVRSQMAELKVRLKAKFGDSINLEE